MPGLPMASRFSKINIPQPKFPLLFWRAVKANEPSERQTSAGDLLAATMVRRFNVTARTPRGTARWPAESQVTGCDAENLSRKRNPNNSTITDLLHVPASTRSNFHKQEASFGHLSDWGNRLPRRVKVVRHFAAGGISTSFGPVAGMRAKGVVRGLSVVTGFPFGHTRNSRCKAARAHRQSRSGTAQREFPPVRGEP